MKPLSIAFLTLLIWAQHAVGVDLVERPLSMFRDGGYAVLGYALFALLLAIGALMAVSLHRARRLGEATVFAIAVTLLVVVVCTPSLDSHLHEAGAISLLLLLFGYYAIQLIVAESSLLYFHLAMPVALTPLLGLGYGPWQKALIVYLLLVINIHWHVLPTLRNPERGSRRRLPAMRRRVVYQLAPGESWERQAPGTR